MPKAILWLDFETTGLDPDDDVLEVAAVLTDNDLSELARFERVVVPRTLDLLWMHPAVIEMHTANGLFDEVLNAGRGYDTTLQSADDALARMLRENGLGKGDVRLAGAGVSHFDHEIIKRRMPQTAHFLHYATLDVSVIRRFVEDVVNSDLLPPELPEQSPHRSMPDVFHALAEARYYRVLLGARP